MIAHRAFADLPHGQVHYAECGDAGAPAVLLLHQSPRSWREFRDVLPLLAARGWRAIAMDSAGFGDSDPVPEPSIEAWAAVARQLLDALGIRCIHVVGHHTGGVIAVELGATDPRVASLVLSSTPFAGEAFRRSRAERPLRVDHVDVLHDGAHLARLWQGRQGFYPAGRPGLLQAFVADALRAHGNPAAGHHVVASYRMEDRIQAIRQPVLLLRALQDPFASPHARELMEHLPQARLVDIPEGGVPLPDQLPEAFAAAVADFLEDQE